MTPRDLRPRTVGELLDAAFFVYRRHFARLALVGILVSVPAVVLAACYSREAAAAVRDFTEKMTEAGKPGRDPFDALERMKNAYGSIVPTSLLALALQAASRAAAALAMTPVALAALRRETPPAVREIARGTWTRLPAAFVLQLAFDLVWTAFSCCCPPIGLVLGVALAPTAAILALERGPMETSLRASVPALVAAPIAQFAACLDALARGMRLSFRAAVFGRGVVFFGVLLSFVWIFAAAVTTPVTVLARESGHWFWVQHCAEMLFLPVLGLARAFWYFDLLARREGADLEAAA